MYSYAAISKEKLNEDKKILQELAGTYMEITSSKRQKQLREEWRRHNSLKKGRPLIVCSWDEGSNLAGELFRDELCCHSPELRGQELFLRNSIYHSTMGDDWLYEPFLVVDAVKKMPPAGDWGYAPERTRIEQAFVTEPFVKNTEDIKKLVRIDHVIDEEQTLLLREFYEEVFDGTINICINRRPFYAHFGISDLSTSLAEILGYENMMIAMLEEPELVHAVLRFMQNAVLTQIGQANENGDFTPRGGWWESEGTPYCEELKDPVWDNRKCTSKELWGFFASQEFTVISPDMFDEFMLQYQMPIMEKYGLVSYGCCENLTNKIKVLKKIPNLRRIGITPTANVASCAEQIQRDYVFALRPNPAMVCADYDRRSVYNQMKSCMEEARGTCFDVMLKDVSTVQNEPSRLFEWVKIAQEIAGSF